MNTNILERPVTAPAGSGAAPQILPQVPRLSARKRLLAAAEELFYEEGVHNVGIERVIERAGVAKASLYGNFKGKDDLVRAYLLQRREARQGRIQARLAQVEQPRDKVLAIFDLLAEIFAEHDYRGCAFMRAAAEMPTGSSGREVCDVARKWTRALFIDLARQSGAAQPEALGHQLHLLYDGAAVSAQMDRDPQAALAARAVAAHMLDVACPAAAKPARRKA
ncbi:MAG: Transcriptional regulator, TetR family protein [Betaproteobacteria bacterium]|nr:Transcriptional regulator, TetR family protein [Betaproteobacteria bacterium]